MDIQNKTCWIITEGMIGTENQCLGVAEALGVNPVIKRIGLRQPWKTFTPWLGCEQPFTFIEPLNPPWPDLVIASGRKAIAASRFIKKRSGGETFTVQIQDPKCNSSDFDLVAVPFHDTMRSDNVIVTHGAPNRLTEDKLNKACEHFAPLFGAMPSPRIAVLIGGNSRTHTLTKSIMEKLVSQLKSLDGSLMVTASRRTGAENLKLLQTSLKDTNAYIWDGTGDNPYHAMLAWADYILVTADSVSMISDAGTTGKPVYVISLDGNSPRFERFHSHMAGIDVMRPFTGNLESWSYEPLQDANFIANEIRKRLG